MGEGRSPVGGTAQEWGRRRESPQPWKQAAAAGWSAEQPVQTSSSSMRAGSISRLLAWSNDTPCQDRTSEGMQVSQRPAPPPPRPAPRQQKGEGDDT